MVKKLDAIKFYEIAESGNTDLYPYDDKMVLSHRMYFHWQLRILHYSK